MALEGEFVLDLARHVVVIADDEKRVGKEEHHWCVCICTYVYVYVCVCVYLVVLKRQAASREG